jgi:ribosomal protein S18 acetylase RimI-like enzyme
MNDLCFRPAAQEDIPFLQQLRAVTMERHEVASGVTPTPERSMSRVLASFETARIILRAGQPAGVVKMLRAGSDWELLQIQIAPEWQARGIGSDIIRNLLAEAKTAGATVRLSVLKENPARRLYERLGFVVVAEKGQSWAMAAGVPAS